MEKPEIVTEEHLEYLDDLRASGVTNMFAAAGYIQRQFEGILTKPKDTQINY